MIIRIILFGGVLALWSQTAMAGTMALFGGTDGSYSVPVMSIKEARFQTTIKQQYDYSCGSAALATLLTYHYDHPVTEHAIFEAMYERGDQEKIRRDGFSLLDMKRHLAVLGYEAEGFRTSLDTLMEWGVPAIVLISDRGYRHFVLIKGITPDRVLIGDPARGTQVVSRAKFEPMWNGLLFVVRNRTEVAGRFFNHERDWRVRTSAPLTAAIGRDGLAAVTIMLGGQSDF